jgi:hypothetical protein
VCSGSYRRSKLSTYVPVLSADGVMPDLQAIAFSNLVTSLLVPALILALAPLDIMVPWVGVGVVPSVVYLIWHPAVALVTLTARLPDSEVPPAGLNAGCATWVIDWVYVALATAEAAKSGVPSRTGIYRFEFVPPPLHEVRTVRVSWSSRQRSLSTLRMSMLRKETNRISQLAVMVYGVAVFCSASRSPFLELARVLVRLDHGASPQFIRLASV